MKIIRTRITIANAIILTTFRTIKIVTTTVNIILKKTKATIKNHKRCKEKITNNDDR